MLMTVLVSKINKGYPCQNADVIFPSSIPDVKFGFVILEQNKIYPMMSGRWLISNYLLGSFKTFYKSGHNTICVATALLYSNMISIPAGRFSFS